MSKKTIFDKDVLIFFASVCGLAFLIIVLRASISIKTGCPDIKIALSSKDLIENVPFSVSYENSRANTWDWDFNDGTGHDANFTANHTYVKAGKYKISLTVNGKCTEFINVNVAPAAVLTPDTSLTPGKPVKPISGVSGNVTPTTEGEPAPEPTAEQIAPNINDKQFVEMLNDIIERKRKRDVNIFTAYLCGKLDLLITVNGVPVRFNEYCKQLGKAAHKTNITTIKITHNPGTNCITKIVITDKEGKYAPLR